MQKQQTQKPYQNCKIFVFRKGELFPNIKESVSKCPPAQKYDNNQSAATESKKSSPVKQRYSMQKKLNAPLDWTQMTPSEVLRRYNCKTFKFSKRESYPNIKPPQSVCNEIEAVQQVGKIEKENCGRFFSMENDDIVEVWKQSPDKNTLGFYGIDTESQQKDAEAFNKLVSKCLKMVKKTTDEKPPKIQPTAVSKKPKQITEDPCDGVVLNHVLLARKVYSMPTVKKKINGIEAITESLCPQRKKEGQPFEETRRHRLVNLNAVLYMDSASRRKRRQRRRQKYSELKTDLPENDCTYLEWLKYKHESRPYDLAFTEEMNRVQVATEQEPKNYEELYEQLMECFENNQLDPMCEAYKACCLKKKYDQDKPKGNGAPGIEVVEEKPEKEDKPVKHKKKSVKPEDSANMEKPDMPDKPDKSKKPGKPEKTEPPKKPERPDKPEKPDAPKIKSKDKPDKKNKYKPDDGDPEDKLDVGKKKPEQGVKSEPQDDDVSFNPKRKDKPKDGDGVTNEPVTETPIDEKPDKPAKVKDKPAKVTDKPAKDTDKPAKDTFKPEKGDKIQIKKKKEPRPKKIPIKKPKTDSKPECPCVNCDFMKRSSDTVFIRQLKEEEKRRELREYYRQMCNRYRKQMPRLDCRVPQLQCDPIDYDNCFCCNPKLNDYSDCLNVINELQKLRDSKHSVNNVMVNLKNRTDIISSRFCVL